MAELNGPPCLTQDWQHDWPEQERFDMPWIFRSPPACQHELDYFEQNPDL